MSCSHDTGARRSRTSHAAGAGANIFGASQELVVRRTTALEQDVVKIARSFVTDEDLAALQAFVSQYVVDQPLEDIAMARDSVVPSFHEFLGVEPSQAVTGIGSLTQVMSDYGSRISVAGARLPAETSWRTELFIRDNRLDEVSLRAELDQVMAVTDRLATVAESTPELLDGTIVRLQAELSLLVDAIDAQRVATLAALTREREAVLEAVARERAATVAELRRTSTELVADAWVQLRRLLTSVLLSGAVLVAVLFGLPFGLGVLTGRALRKRV